MSVKKRLRHGDPVWVVDLTFWGKKGKERYRRDARIQSKAGAEQEERRVIQYFTLHDTIAGLLKPEAAVATLTRNATWDDAVRHWKAHQLQAVSESTRKGYEGVLGNKAFKAAWDGKPLAEITYSTLTLYFATLGKTRKPATLHQHRSVLLGVLKAVGPHGEEAGLYLDHLPQFPPKVKIGKQGFELPTDEQVETVFSERYTEGSYLQAHSLRRLHLAFALAAHAGLRASEVRGLLRTDVDLVKKVLTIRNTEHHGVVEGTKSGDERKVPVQHPRLIRLLTERLKEMERSDAEDHVAISSRGDAWGQYGLRSAYRRTCERLKLPLSKYHGLRHYFCTGLIRRGVPLTTVMSVMGHGSLVVTNRYAHAVGAEAAGEELAKAFADVGEDE